MIIGQYAKKIFFLNTSFIVTIIMFTMASFHHYPLEYSVYVHPRFIQLYFKYVQIGLHLTGQKTIFF